MTTHGTVIKRGGSVCEFCLEASCLLEIGFGVVQFEKEIHSFHSFNSSVIFSSVCSQKKINLIVLITKANHLALVIVLVELNLQI